MAYYLKDNVVIEPLVMRWYAWSHLISPATSAMNVAFRHLAIMESYVKAPSLHVEAVRTPALRGGPFLNHPPKQVGQIRELLEETKNKQKQQIEFAEGVKEAIRIVLKMGDGMSLSPIYPLLPQPVKGYIELCYSIGGGADIRVIEGLLYRSPIYNPSFQSAVMHQIRDDERAFALSTPRLHRDDALEISNPFNDSIYDFLSNLRHTPESVARIMERLDFKGENEQLLKSFLTETPPAKKERAKSRQTRWRYFGHACVLIEAPDGTNILLDPIFAYQNGAHPDRFTIADIPGHIDYVVLTHNHMDHVLIESLLALRPKIKEIVIPSGGGTLADPSLKLALNAIGFNSVLELSPLCSIETGDTKITALPFFGEHADLDISTKAAWLVDVSGLKMLFAADSNNIEPRLYDLLSPLIGSLDILFIGLECAGAPLSWVYGALLPRPLEQQKDNSRRLDGSNCERAMKVIQSLQCKKVFIYAMGMEPWLSFITSIDPSDETVPNRNAQELIRVGMENGVFIKKLFGKEEACN